MTVRLLPSKDLAQLVTSLVKQAEVWAPVRIQDREASRFGRIRDLEEACLDYLNTKLPVKELFLPQREILFNFKPGECGTATPAATVPTRVVLGVRPCDAAALLLLDKVFLHAKYCDPYYGERRGMTTLVGLACNEPGDACFCSATGGGPHSTRGFDLLLVDLGDRYLVRPVTEKGLRLVANVAEAGEENLKQADELAAKARAAMSFTVDLDALRERLDRAFCHDVWQELALPCGNCGVCTYVCPTCHCFDVTDEENKDSGARVRTWDSCQFSLFTRHASGHNPRPTGLSRMRNRTLHKFLYFPKTQNKVLCVGCGRCITDCPAGIDLRDTLETLGERRP